MIFLQDSFDHPPPKMEWVNGNFYIQSSEALGIVSVPPDIQEICGMTEYLPSLQVRRKHNFLAKMQGTNKAVLPIHNQAEKDLFKLLMETNADFNSPSGPQWKRAAKVWNSYANSEENIFYKVGVLEV